MFVEETQPGVIRFPIEMRRTEIWALGEVAPDVREIDLIAERHGFDPPRLDLRETAEADTLEKIEALDQSDIGAYRMRLRVMADQAIAVAIERSLAWKKAHAEAIRMEARHDAAPVAQRGFFQRSMHDANQIAAVKALLAHEAVQRAYGIDWVTDLALRNEPYAPFDANKEMMLLMETMPPRSA